MARKAIKSISRNGKAYLSLYYASSLCGYHKDYLGQLIRSGKLSAERIGNAWFIEEDVFKRFREKTSISVERPLHLDNSSEVGSPAKKLDVIDIKEIPNADPSRLDEADPWDHVLLGEKPVEKEPVTIPVRSHTSFLANLSLKPLVFSMLILVVGFFVWQHPQLPLRVYTNLEHASKKATTISGALLHQAISGIYDIDIKTTFAPIQEFLETGPLFVGRQVGSWLSEKGAQTTKALVTLITKIKEQVVRYVLPSPPVGGSRTFLSQKGKEDVDVGPSRQTSIQGPSLEEKIQELTSQGLQTQPTIIEKTVVERTIERIISGLSQGELDLAIQALNNKFLNEIAELRALVSSRANANFRAIALTNRINALSSVTINDSILNSATVSGVTGLTDSDIPNDITIASSNAFSATLGSFSSTLTVSETLSIEGTATSTIAGQLSLTKIPTLVHAFGTWASGVTNSNVLDAALLINPASAVADTNLFGIAVGDSVKFLVDAEGDVFANNLTTSGTVTQGLTTISTLTVENNTTLGDAIGDTVTFNAGTLIFNNVATTTILQSINAWSIATSSTATPILSIDGLNGRMGIGTTTPNEQFEITGNFRLPPSTLTAGIIKSGDDTFIHNFGTDNFFAGVNAGNFAMTGTKNVAVGLNALIANLAGGGNTALGSQALTNNTEGGSNVGVGELTGLNNFTGSNNVFIGAFSDVTIDGLSNAIAIGSNAKVSASNSLILGGTGANAVNVGIGTTTPSFTLDVQGNIRASDAFLFSDGSTQAMAATPSGFSWRVGSASFLQATSTIATVPLGIFFKPDGTKMYVLEFQGADVNEYDLSTPWDVSTSLFLQTFSVTTEDAGPADIFFKPDGTKMYVLGLIGIDVNEYNLSTPWDVSTASFNQLFDVSGEDTAPHDIFFKPDGTKMYVMGRT
ncbi:hypothetical protein IIA95_00255, partial [Patescibacteria group bacterium]|nr:hypothetical protein [Patescibacteria group bacterium]